MSRGAEACAPELMAEHGDACRRFTAVFTGSEAAAGLHPDAKDVEVIAGHGIRRRRAAHLIRLEVDRELAVRHQSVEAARLVSEKPELRKRETDRAAGAARAAAAAADRARLRDRDDARRLGDSDHRPKRETREHREEARVQPDGHAERDDRDQRESRLPAQTAHGVGDVLPDAFEPRPDPDGARILARAGEIAEHLVRRQPCLTRRVPVPLELLLRHGAVELQFLGEVVLKPAEANERPEPSQES